ncbi:MAG: helix-turn-helix domain-containing protein [Pseudomonadota bacterium]
MNTISPKSYAAIIEAAFATFSARPTATLADVAEAAGVGRATLHRHFAGRDELMVALAHQAMEELDTAFDDATRDAASYAEALRLGLAAMIPLGDRQLFLASEPVDRDPEIAARYRDDLAELAKTVDAAKEEGAFERHIPTDWIVKSYEALLFAAWEALRDGELTAAQAADLAWRTLTRGTAPDVP